MFIYFRLLLNRIKGGFMPCYLSSVFIKEILIIKEILYTWLHTWVPFNYRNISNIRRIKSQNLNVSRLGLAVVFAQYIEVKY